MKAAELRKKSNTKLEELLLQKRERLGKLRFSLASGRVKNVREIKKVQRDIARILTILKEQRTANKEQIVPR